MRKRDIFVIIVIMVFAICSYFVFNKVNNEIGSSVVVIVDNVEKEIFDINEHIEYKIEVENGYNILKIENGYANIIQATCPDKYCVNQKKINKNNEKIICLPNKVIIEIRGGEKNIIDAVAN